MKKIIPLALIIFAMSSCNKYYKAVMGNTGEKSEKTIDSLINDGRYFVFRRGSQAFAMNNIVISHDTKTVQCMLDVLPDAHQLYFMNGNKNKMIYPNPEDYQPIPVLNEVHLFSSNTNSTVNAGPFTLPLSQVQKIEIIEKDKIKTRRSRNKGAIIAVGASLLGVAVIFGVAAGLAFLSLF